jgi:DNA-binding NarL/FixJ family response regulator
VSDPIRILIADDHPVVRDGLAAMLGTQADFLVAGSAGTGVGALRLAAALRPDVVLLDIEMPEGDGIAVTAALHLQQPAVRIIVFTAFDRDEQILKALQAGADGYLLKGTEREQVFRAIRAAHVGQSLMEPVVAAKLIRSVRQNGPALTDRERQVLQLVARGLPNKLIARELGCSERTAKFHVSSLLRKLDATNRTEAVAAARERGLL